MTGKKRGNKKNNKMKNRRGLSSVVITLILVAITLVAIFFLWGPIRNLIRQNTEMTNIQNQFFAEQINILNVYFNGSSVDVTVKKPAGQMKTSTVNLTGSWQQQQSSSDIFSIVDLSGSMRECLGITQTRCNRMGGNWQNPICNTLAGDRQIACVNYTGVWNDKLGATQNANQDMINNLLGSGSNRIGLIGYKDAVVPSASVDLTNDGALLNATMALWTDTGTTCICCGIQDATTKFLAQSSAGKLKSMIVMSDGDANVNCSGGGSNNAKNDSVKLACAANSTLNNLVIYGIGVQGADEATLTAIAKCGGGKYYSVLNTSDLIAVYQTIAEQIEQRYESMTAFNYLYFQFYNATDSVREQVTDIPKILETKTYNFNLQGKLSGTITRIEVYPVVLTTIRQEIIGPLLAVWTNTN